MQLIEPWGRSGLGDLLRPLILKFILCDFMSFHFLGSEAYLQSIKNGLSESRTPCRMKSALVIHTHRVTIQTMEVLFIYISTGKGKKSFKRHFSFPVE